MAWHSDNHMIHQAHLKHFPGLADAASERAKAKAESKETDAKEKSEKPAPRADEGTKKQAA